MSDCLCFLHDTHAFPVNFHIAVNLFGLSINFPCIILSYFAAISNPFITIFYLLLLFIIYCYNPYFHILSCMLLYSICHILSCIFIYFAFSYIFLPMTFLNALYINPWYKFICIITYKPRKQPCNHSAYHKKRHINKNAAHSKHKIRCKNLTCVMRHCSKDAC